MPKGTDEGIGFITGKRIPSSLKSINRMLNGGYIPGIATGLYGAPECGKTILVLQEAFTDVLGWEEFYGEKKSILFFDTEGGAEGVLEEWYPVFVERFGIKPKILHEDKRSFLDILEWFGYPATTHISKKGGQVHIRPRGFEQPIGTTRTGKKMTKRVLFNPDPPANRYCEKHNVGTIIIDSITEPIDGFFTGGNPQYPGRAEAVNAWFGRIHWLAKPDLQNVPKSEIPKRIVRCILHESVTPGDKYSRSVMKGGHNVRYKFKVSLHMRASPKNAFDHVKTMNMARYFSKKSWTDPQLIIMTDDGYIDPSKQQAENLWKDKDLFREEAGPDFSGAAARRKKTVKQKKLG